MRWLCWIFNEDKFFKEVLIRFGKCFYLKVIFVEGLYYFSDFFIVSFWNGERKGCFWCSVISYGVYDCYVIVEWYFIVGRYLWCWIFSLNEFGEVEYELVFEFVVVVFSWIFVFIFNYIFVYVVLNLLIIGK